MIEAGPELAGLAKAADPLDIAPELEQLETSLRSHIVKNADRIRFTQPQYKIESLGEGQYNIHISITGLGRQEFKLLLLGEDFALTGKLAIVGQDASFPFNIIADLVNGAIAKWISQTAEDLAKAKAIKIAKAVKAEVAQPQQLNG